MSDQIKLIRVISQGINEPDDPSFPFKLEASLRPPSFMDFAFSVMYGNEDVTLRGMTIEAVNEAIDKLGLRGHPRLIYFVVTGPDGAVIERVGR